MELTSHFESSFLQGIAIYNPIVIAKNFPHAKSMDPYILYNAEFKVLICNKHQCAIPPAFIERHFWHGHKEVPLQTRRRIVECSRKVETYSPSEVTTPMEVIDPIKGLKLRSGFRCTYDKCGNICGTIGSIKEHSKAHKWGSMDVRRWREIKAQTFFEGQYLRWNYYENGSDHSY